MFTQDYTKLATIMPVVLSSSAYRHLGSAVFPEGRTSVTLVTSPDHFAPVFKLGGKIPLFTAENNPDGTVKLTSTNLNFPSWLTIAGRELVRLTDKAGVDIDEPFMDLGEHLAFHYDPSDDPMSDADELAELLSPTFVTPTLDDCDLADFADASLGSFYASPTRNQCVITRKPQNQKRGQRAPRKRISNKYRKRITRKSPNYRGRFPTPRTSAQSFEQDVALLWG